jgi:tetratricopeptide (TPR) repeat protein/predicted aspartyl protease
VQTRTIRTTTGTSKVISKPYAPPCAPRWWAPRSWASALAVFSLWIAPLPGLAACKLGKMAELPVTMSGSTPLIAAKINGEDAHFIADSGAFYSMITAAAAAQFKLKLSPAPFGFHVKGVAGDVDPSVATVKIFTLAGNPLRNVEFLVGGSAVGGSENVGILGQNIFRAGDVEYDLAKGVIRLMHADGCSHALLAYWVNPSESYSVIDIERATPLQPHTTATAFINGERIRVMFDTGSAMSVLKLRAAERAGVKPDSTGVVDAGYFTGIGRGATKTYLGAFSSFKIGDEEIRNTRLRFGDISVDNVDMLLGADFFLSHRIYVASSQNKLFFTYNGGRVFNLTASMPPTAPAGTAAGASPDAQAGADRAQAGIDRVPMGADRPDDAEAFSRRGTAFAARRDYDHALAELTRACELAPDESEYFYQRGVVYREIGQAAPAMADFNRAIELKPGDPGALAARAALRVNGGDRDGAIADLDATDRAAPRQADVRLFLAQAYEHLDLPVPSIAQYDLWIASHREDARTAQALSNRCRVWAWQGGDLAMALADCNEALRSDAKGSALLARTLSNRALVRLRSGDYGKSIADYDDALKLAPKDPWFLYGRGVAEIREKKTAAGNADIASATAISASIGDAFKRHGIVP